MIGIWNKRIVYIEEEKYNREVILNEYQNVESGCDSKFVITSNGKILSVLDYIDILLRRTPKNIILSNQENMFYDAIAYFSKCHTVYSGSCVGVLNGSGKLQYILEYIDNSNFIDKTRVPHLYKWFSYSNLEQDRMIPIVSIVNDITVLVVETLEEYSIHIIQLLLQVKKKYPKTKVYCLDKRANEFFLSSDVTIINEIPKEVEQESYNMLISKSYKNSPYKSTDQRTTYLSAELMMKLYEASTIEKLNPQIDSKFIIYNDSFIGNGLVDILKFSICNNILGKHAGCIPVINITDNIAYSEGTGENVWEYYFEPINGYTVDQAYASGNYEVISRTNSQMIAEQVKTCEEEGIEYNLYEEINKIRWISEIRDYCQQEVPLQFYQGQSMLGIIARGTDYNKAAVIKRRGIDNIKNATVDQIIDLIKAQYVEEEYHYLYVATEDAYNFTQLKQVFGERIVTTNQERINVQREKQYLETIIAKIPKKKRKYEYGLDYLVVLLSLSRCDALVASMRCGACVAAIGLNNNKYKSVKIIKSDH